MNFPDSIFKVLKNEPLDNRDIEALGKWLASEDGKAGFDNLVMDEIDSALAEDPRGDFDYDSLLARIRSRIENPRVKINTRRRMSRLRRIAAVLLVGILGGGLAYYLTVSTGEAEPLTIPAGSSVALLQLHDGTTVDLAGMEGDAIDQKGAITTVHDGTLSYDNEKLSDRLAFNKIIVPKGGEYKVILSDGTTVWLNSESSLRYPLNFTRGRREVHLEGEAYFEVAPDKEKPFIVETGVQRVTVLGTSFNVSAYPDEDRALTTLLSGSVVVTSKTTLEEKTLSPGQQAQLDGRTDLFDIATVNVDQVIAWKNGLFVFDDHNLGHIMRKLGRWYDVDIVFENPEADSIAFKGNLPRYDDLERLLEMIEKISPAKFEIQGRTVVVSM